MNFHWIIDYLHMTIVVCPRVCLCSFIDNIANNMDPDVYFHGKSLWNDFDNPTLPKFTGET